jgi:hypothetical protein
MRSFAISNMHVQADFSDLASEMRKRRSMERSGAGAAVSLLLKRGEEGG